MPWRCSARRPNCRPPDFFQCATDLRRVQGTKKRKLPGGRIRFGFGDALLLLEHGSKSTARTWHQPRGEWTANSKKHRTPRSAAAQCVDSETEVPLLIQLETDVS